MFDKIENSEYNIKINIIIYNLYARRIKIINLLIQHESQQRINKLKTRIIFTDKFNKLKNIYKIYLTKND